MGISFLRGSLVKYDHFTPDELKEHEIGYFCLCLLVQPRKGVYDLDITLAAFPHSLDQLKALPIDEDLLFVPCIKVWRSTGHLSVNGDNLPAYLVLTGPSATCPNTPQGRS